VLVSGTLEDAETKRDAWTSGFLFASGTLEDVETKRDAWTSGEIENRNKKIKNILSALKKEDFTNTITKHLQHLHIKMSDEALSILVYFLTTKNYSSNINESVRQIEGLTKKVLALNNETFKD